MDEDLLLSDLSKSRGELYLSAGFDMLPLGIENQPLPAIVRMIKMRFANRTKWTSDTMSISCTQNYSTPPLALHPTPKKYILPWPGSRNRGSHLLRHGMCVFSQCMRHYLSRGMLCLSLLLYLPTAMAQNVSPDTGDLLSSFPNTLDGSSSPVSTSGPPLYVVIQPSDEVTFSSETTASIAVINVKEGSQFRAGDILLEMDCRVQQADLDKAQAQMKLADIALSSAKKLKTYDAISDFELAQAVSKLKARVQMHKNYRRLLKNVRSRPFQWLGSYPDGPCKRNRSPR